MSLIYESNPELASHDKTFEIESYLGQRAQVADFIMVEFGHGGIPVAYQQPNDFTGKRAYIGVEAWLRDPYERQRSRVKELKLGNPNQNVFYINHDTKGEVVRDDDLSERHAYYSGFYDAATNLPDKCASEVLLSNVFGDSLIAHYQDSTAKILAEAFRIIADDGLIVVRETITPVTAQLKDRIAWQAGLTITKLERIAACQTLWQNLETVFDGEPGNYDVNANSFYLFMAKALKTHIAY